MRNQIVAENLWWQYEGAKDWILKGINLTVKQGEFLGIMGPSGAGKTTLCMCMNGLIPQRARGRYKGCVKIGDLDTIENKMFELAGKVGMVFQDPETQFVMMTVEDEIALGLENLALPREEMRERVRWAMDVVGLSDDFLGKTPLELSGGEKQRIAIASILALKPEILILDEPTSNLDPVGKAEVFSTVEDLKNKFDITIIVVEHEAEKLAEFADRIIVIYNGQIVEEGSPREVFKKVDTLKSLGIRSPQVTEFAQYKKWDDVPITINEAEKKLAEMLKKEQYRIQKIEVKTEGKRSREPIIQAENLHYTYPNGGKALKGVSLTIGKGDYLAIIGPNGSGKTTLAKHFNGILKPTDGKVLVDGSDIKKATITKLASKVGYCFQNPDHQLFCQTVKDEVAFGPLNLGLTKEEVEERVDKALKTVGLEIFGDEHPFFLGKGQRQRLAIASILAMEPEVLIIDEPTTGQDYRMAEEIMCLLDQLNEKGHTVIIITHNMPLVCEHVERVIVMLDGKIIVDGPPAEIFTREDVLREAHLYPPQITQLAKKLAKFGVPGNVLTVEQMNRVLS